MSTHSAWVSVSGLEDLSGFSADRLVRNSLAHPPLPWWPMAAPPFRVNLLKTIITLAKSPVTIVAFVQQQSTGQSL